MGAFLRDLVRRGVVVQDRVLVTPTSQTGEVCEYLRREKLRWRVVGLTEDRLAPWHTPHAIVYFETTADGRIRRVVHAATPDELRETVLPETGTSVPAPL